jgi:flagellar basal body L-ring protein FlgH
MKFKSGQCLITPLLLTPVRCLMTAGLVIALSCNVLGAADKKPKKPVEPSALDRYIQEAMSHGTPAEIQSTSGSLWSPASRLSDIGSDLRAVQVNDLVTVVVSEQASAVVTGDVTFCSQESDRGFE